MNLLHVVSPSSGEFRENRYSEDRALLCSLKEVMTFLFAFLLFVFSSMQPYMFTSLYWVTASIVKTHEVKPYFIQQHEIFVRFL